MTPDVFAAAISSHRSELLRHCYRMLGSFHAAEDVVQDVLVNALRAQDTYAGTGSIRSWLFRIATNMCINARRARRVLPVEVEPSSLGTAPVGEPTEIDSWITPASDDALFDTTHGLDAATVLEQREAVSLAFIALLQTVPARQRACLLLKDVVGFAVNEIAATLDMTAGAVASALSRAREAMAAYKPHAASEPPSQLVRDYVRCWETQDIDGLIGLLRADAALAMPPWTMWISGREEIRRFLSTDHVASLWSHGLSLSPTHANQQLAFLFRKGRSQLPHSVQLLRFDGAAVIEMTSYIGASFLHGFKF